MIVTARRTEGDQLATRAMESFVAHKTSTASSEEIDPNCHDHVEPNAQAHVEPNTQVVDVSTDVKAVMDLLKALNVEFDIGRKIASCRSGGRMHALASYTSDGGHRVEIDLHFGSSV